MTVVGKFKVDQAAVLGVKVGGRTHSHTHTKSHNVLSKSTTLCWATFAAIVGCMRLAGHRLDNPGRCAGWEVGGPSLAPAQVLVNRRTALGAPGGRRGLRGHGWEGVAGALGTLHGTWSSTHGDPAGRGRHSPRCATRLRRGSKPTSRTLSVRARKKLTTPSVTTQPGKPRSLWWKPRLCRRQFPRPGAPGSKVRSCR